MQLHTQYEWDISKAKTNLKKHGVSFEAASFMLSDAAGDFYHHEQYDHAHSDSESRFITYASHPEDRRIVLAIVWSELRDRRGGELVTRLISARHATKQEKKQYAQYIGQKNRA